MLRSVCLLSVSLFAITLSAPLHAAPKKVTESFKLKNLGASAAFFGADNCVAAAVNVFYSEIVTKTNGDKDRPNPTTFVELGYQNICTGDAFMLSGTIDQQQAQIRGDLGGASLTASVPVSNEDGTKTATLYVNLNFTATGPITTFKDDFKSKGGGVRYKRKATSQSRPALATGTVAGILPLDAGPHYENVIFDPSESAQINKNLFGEVTVTRPAN